MAVSLLLIIFFLNPQPVKALERAIKQNWNRLTYPHRVQQLYSLLNFRCIWFCEGKPTEDFYVLQELFKEAVHHGLNPEDYRPAEGLDPEMALTDSLFKFSYHLYYGKVNPSKLYESWNIPQKPDIVLETLYRLITEKRLRELIHRFAPKGGEYWFLVEQAKFLKDISSLEWSSLNPAGSLKHGDISPCIPEISYRLFLLGDLKEYTGSDFYDEKLLQAVKSFQLRHGLAPTGILDKRTLKELNVNPSERLKQVYLNLEKHRWLPYNLTEGVIVNIPSFELFFLSKGSLLLYSKVIVGRNYRQDFRPTPMLYSRIESITVNPRWYVPSSISVKDILPKVKKDPGYLKRKGFRVFLDGKEIDPVGVDWSLYNENHFPFRLVQEAGPKNSLGRVKFNFPNPFAVYLHDTPEKHLFKHTKRAFSSGCIRVERARELALYLLGEGWNYKKLEGLIKTGNTRTITLKKHVPVYLLYFTAFGKEGELHFREDLYEYDKMLSRVYFSSGGKK